MTENDNRSLEGKSNGLTEACDLRVGDLYHIKTSEDQLEPGFSIAPGNWGRIIRERNLQHPIFEREFILEYVRKWHFPTRLSRLDCNYAFIALEDALYYQTHIQKEGYIYKVKVKNPECNFHLACFNYLPPPFPGSKKGHWRIPPMDVAVGYWQGHTIKMMGAPGQCMELLVDSELIIMEMIKKPLVGLSSETEL